MIDVVSEEQKVEVLHKVINKRLHSEVVIVQRYEADLGERIRLHVIGEDHQKFEALPEEFFSKSSEVVVRVNDLTHTFKLSSPVAIPYCLTAGGAESYAYKPNDFTNAIFNNWYVRNNTLLQTKSDLFDALAPMVASAQNQKDIVRLLPEASGLFN